MDLRRPLILLDLDGTLIPHGGSKPSQESVDLLGELGATHNIGIVTGRVWATTKGVVKLLEDAGIPVVVTITNNGASYRWGGDDRAHHLSREFFSPKAVKTLANLFRHEPSIYGSYMETEDGTVWSFGGKVYSPEHREVAVSCGRLDPLGAVVCAGAAFTNETAAASFVSQLQREVGDLPYCSINHCYVDISWTNHNKASLFEVGAPLHMLTQHTTLFVGDGSNDVPLMKLLGPSKSASFRENVSMSAQQNASLIRGSIEGILNDYFVKYELSQKA